MIFRPSAWTVLAAAVVCVFLVGPSIIAIPASLTDMSYLSLPKEGLSLQHYRRFVSDSSWLRAFSLSLWTSVVSAFIATLLGTTFSIGAWSIAGRWSQALRVVVLLPLVVPGIIAALAMYLLWTRLGLYDTVPGVILVQIIVGVPFVAITTSTALSLFDVTQLRASRSLGAGSMRTLVHVVLPNIRGSILAGFVLALVSGWDEAVITLFITGRTVQVLPRKIWDSLRYDIDPIVAVVATIMLVATFVGVFLFLLLSGKSRHAANPNAH